MQVSTETYNTTLNTADTPGQKSGQVGSQKYRIDYTRKTTLCTSLQFQQGFSSDTIQVGVVIFTPKIIAILFLPSS